MMECRCENIVGYDACFLINNQLWIVMELCEGGSLNDLMKLTRSTLTEEQIAVCMRDILQALAYLHDHNRIHRDIKAGNVLLTSEGVAKLADFGVSGTLSKDTAQRHTVIGTPFWMAPEVIQETGHNYKADIWSLGITLIELAEGHPPLCNLHPLRAIFVIPSRPPPSFTDKSKWSPEMNEFLALCLTKDPNQRPTAKQLLLHPWLLKYASSTGAILKPLIEISDDAVKAAGGRDAALNALYADSDDSDDSDASGSKDGSEGSDSEEINTGTMQIKNDEYDEDNDEDGDYSTMKVKSSPISAGKQAKSGASSKASKKKSKKSKHPKKDSEEEDDDGGADYGTMKVVKDTDDGEVARARALAGEDDEYDDDDDDNSTEYEDMGTVQIKKDKKKKKKSNVSSKSDDNSSTVVVKKDVSVKMKDERLGTLARGESPKVRLARQELDELDAGMVAKLQTIHKELTKDRELIATILAARKV